MAEDLNASEDLQSSDINENLNLDSEMTNSSPLNDLASIANSYKATPAKLDSDNIYKYVVGNPLSGSNPGKDDPNYAANAFADVKRKTLSDPKNEYANLRPYTYSGDFDGANFERYYKSSAYKTLGFSPYRDNESLYNDNMTFGDEFVRAASQWPSLVKTGFMSGVKSWGDLFTDPLAPDIESAREMKRAMAVGASSKGGVGGFITNTFLNSGYTVGIGLDLLGEELALMGATALTGGLSAEATAPAMLSRLFGSTKKIAKGLDVAEDIVETTKKTSKATEAYKAINNVNDARSFWNTVPGKIVSKTGSILNPLENTTQALRATDYATDYAKAVGTFGAFARDVMMTKAAVSEAKLEAGMTKIDTTEELIRLYREQNGVDPTGEELQKIENIASQQAYKTAVWNLPAIMWSNKFMYETMFAPIDKLVKPNLAKFADDIVFDKKTFAAAGEGFFARTKLAAKALKNPKVYGRYAFDYLKGNFAEGIQENLQEAIAQASAEQAIALYKDPATADYEGYMSYMMKGLGDQFSAQGAETFASGFLMSMFASPMMSAPSYAISKSLDLTINKNKVKEAKEARDKQRAQEVAQLNEFYKNDIAFLAPDLPNAIKQQKMSDDLAQALEDGDILKARNIKDESVFEHIHTALRTGKYDVFLNKLKDYKNLSPEEAKDAFKEYGIEDGNKALKYIDKVIARAENIRNNYETVSNEMPNPFNYKQYSPENPLFKANLVAGHAWEEAKKKLIFSRDAFETLSSRMEKMTQSFSTLANNIAKSDVQTFMSLMSPEGAITEINTLKKELSALDPSISEQKSVIKDKQKKLELLEAFYDAVSKSKFGETEQERKKSDKESKKHFKNILKYIAGKNNSLVFDTQMDEAYQTILDNMTLSDERKGLVKSINVLTNPEGFLTVQRRLANVYNQIIDDKENTLKYNNDVFTGRRESNITLNAIYQATGLILKPEDLKALRDALINGTPIPKITSLIDKSTEQEVSGDDARFKVAKQIWEDRLPLIQTGEVAEEEEETKEPKKKEEPTEDIILNDSSTYPKELIDILEKEYNRRIEAGTLDPSLTLEDYIDSPFSGPIVKKYIAKYKEEQLAKEDIYSGMPLDKLKAEYDALLKKDARTPEEEANLINIENAIVMKELKNKLTPEQLKALEKLEKISKSAIKKEDQSGYLINNVDYNLRVTKLADRISVEVYNDKPYKLLFLDTDSGKLLIELYQKAIKDISVKSKYPETYASNIIKYIEDQINKKDLKSAYSQILVKGKLDEFKLLLAKNPESLDVFKEALNSVFYKESKDTGNTVDEIARNYFEGKPIKKPSNMTDKAFTNLVEALGVVRTKLKEKGEFIVSKGVKVFGKYNVKGSEENVAGELDLLVIDKNGNFKIYDIKTSKDWSQFGEKGEFDKKQGYTLQLSIYKKILEDMLGIKVNSLALLPLETKSDTKSNIKQITPVFDTKNAAITYDKVVEDYLQPIGKKTVSPPAPAPAATTTGKTKPEDIKPNTKYKGIVNGLPATINVTFITDKGPYKGNATVNVTYDDNRGGFGGNSTVEEIASWINAKPTTTTPTPTDWNSLIANAVSEKELNAIIDQATKENVDLDFTIINKKRDTFKKPAEPTTTTTTDAKADIERKRQETNNKNEKYIQQISNINLEEEIDRDNLINKLIKDIPLPANTRINNWTLEELIDEKWVGKKIANQEEYFGKENWGKIKEAKKQFDIEFKKIEDSNLSKIALIEQEQSNLLKTVDGLELRKAWSFGLIEEPNIVGLDETNFISKETEFKNGDWVETGNYEGYYYLSKPNKDDEWYEQIIGKTEQEVKDKINAKYDAEIAALKSKPTETQVVSTEAFNASTVEQKFKEVSKELKGDNVLFGTYRKGEYDTYDSQSYEVVLDDGRVLRTVPTQFNKKNAEGKTVIPEGQKVALKTEMVETDTGIKKAIGVYRLDENGIPKTLSFTTLREKTPEFQVENKNINLTLEDINKEINVNSLIVAKDRGYEVIYSPIGSFENPVNYLVKNIDRKGKKEVTLYSPLAPEEVTISIDSISSVIKGIIDPNSAGLGKEDKDTVLNNKNSIKKPSTSFDNDISEDDALNNLLNNLCS